jgi:hypothetical protein
MSSWSTQAKVARRRRDAHVLFVVTYKDGSRGFVRIPPDLAGLGGTSSPSIMHFVDEEQKAGRLGAGSVTNLIRVR